MTLTYELQMKVDIHREILEVKNTLGDLRNEAKNEFERIKELSAVKCRLLAQIEPKKENSTQVLQREEKHTTCEVPPQASFFLELGKEEDRNEIVSHENSVIENQNYNNFKIAKNEFVTDGGSDTNSSSASAECAGYDDLLKMGARRIRETKSLIEKRDHFNDDDNVENLKMELLRGQPVRRAVNDIMAGVMRRDAVGCEVIVDGKSRGQRAFDTG